jgi:hypothetical protein
MNIEKGSSSWKWKTICCGLFFRKLEGREAKD